MSVTLALAQVRDIVEGTTPSDSARGRGRSFRHVPQGQRLALADSRSYWLEPRDTVEDFPLSPAPHRIRTVDLVVFYRADPSTMATLREAVEEDRDALCARLRDPALYGRPSSTLVDVRGPEGAFMASSVEELAEGLLLVVSLVVEHT